MAKMMVVEIIAVDDEKEALLNEAFGKLNEYINDKDVEMRAFSLESGQTHLAQVPADAD